MKTQSLAKRFTALIKKSEGGILPDDNVTIYVPMDLNVDGIMRQLYAFFMMRSRS